MDQQYDGDTVIEFGATGNKKFCIGELSGYVKLREFCSKASDTLWVMSSNNLISVGRSDALGKPTYLTAGSTADKTILIAASVREGWHQWKQEPTDP